MMTLRKRLEDRCKAALNAYDGHWDEVPVATCEEVTIGGDHFHVCTQRRLDGGWHHRYKVNGVPRLKAVFDHEAMLVTPANGEPL